ncbi:hypothetical protein KHA94_01505 [Bacillus sp. FJAT-49705]|uniref:Uncharacterized protein n=1 Tax=Cytobacillus citreus TaxID=2833586 RepID=A0ABS5NM62_9BACI|nr:hypothetical protein [Cytobacillus citreus]MBS4188895.1 hypothetical protein [Cytobacillus citreus]
MKKKMLIIDIVYNENQNEVELMAEDGCSIKDLKPMEQMLVDSDNLSFIYITDQNDDYTYVSIPDIIWVQLKRAIDLNMSVFLSNRHERIHLPGFIEELSYLIENIKGNSNYGETMVEKVESIF